jgi:hypothetical protein
MGEVFERGRAGEVVGLFADRPSFEGAVAALLAAGFTRADLSVLSTHESLDAAQPVEISWRDRLTALVGELRYEGPLVASGAIMLAGGGIASWLAGLIGAAVGGLAIKELLEEATVTPHTADFARSLAAGSIILWVRAETAAEAGRAEAILADRGGSNVHRVPAGGDVF